MFPSMRFSNPYKNVTTSASNLSKSIGNQKYLNSVLTNLDSDNSSTFPKLGNGIPLALKTPTVAKRYVYRASKDLLLAWQRKTSHFSTCERARKADTSGDLEDTRKLPAT